MQCVMQGSCSRRRKVAVIVGEHRGIFSAAGVGKTITKTATEEFTLAQKLASTTVFESLRSDSSVQAANRSVSSRQTMRESWPMKLTSTL